MKTNLKINIAVLVSGGGTNLRALINAQKKGLLRSGRIALVISDRADAYALKRAEKAEIPTAGRRGWKRGFALFWRNMRLI